MRRGLLLVAALLVAANASAQPYGPQASITCPANAVDIWPGVDINLVVVANPGNTTFCLRAGVHPITYSTTPKSGDVFIGEYGAILDGSTWVTPDLSQGAFRALNVDVNDVTIRNVVIRHMPEYGIYTYSSGWCDASHHCFFSTAGADGWIVEHNEIASNINGLHVSSTMQVRQNYIHHNGTVCGAGVRSGGIYAFLNQDTLIENNEISYNACEMKFAQLSPRTIARGNWVHHNLWNGLWYDGENSGSLIEFNTVEDNAGIGIFYEVSGQGVIRNNTVRRNGWNGIIISDSHDVEIHSNTLTDNWRNISYFLDCARLYILGDGEIGVPTYLGNVWAHDNAVNITAAAVHQDSWASNLDFANCTTTQLAPYLSGSFNLTFTHNTYQVPNVAGAYWLWGPSLLNWSRWQAIPQDVDSTLTVSTPPPLIEICGNGIDDDGDGLIDENCAPPPTDTTNPMVTLNVRRNGNSSNYTATTTATDNVGVTLFQASLDGVVFVTDTVQCSGGCGLRIQDRGVHEFKAVASDAAGNMDTKIVTVTR